MSPANGCRNKKQNKYKSENTNMGFFDGIDSVDPSGASPRFPPDGDFIIRVHECRVHQGQWGVRFIVEADVLQSSMPEVSPGTRRSWTVQVDGAYAKIGLGEVKSFAAVCHGIDPTNTEAVNRQITKAVMDSAVLPHQPLRGRVLRTTTSSKDTKGGQEITKHLWYVVDATQAASIGVELPTTPVPAPVAAPMPPGVAAPPPPAPAAPPPVSGPFPPPGWTAHPSAPGFYYKGQEVKSEADLRASMAPPTPPTPPSLPGPPVPPSPPPAPAPAAAPPMPFPPPGWTLHPSAPGFYYKGQDVKSEAQLRELSARGAA